VKTTIERERPFPVRNLKETIRKHLLMTTLSSQERDANAEVEEVPDEMILPFRQVPQVSSTGSGDEP
jgi:hypothetical protein